MNTDTQQLLAQALKLPVSEKAALVDQLLASLDKPDEAIDALWRQEVEDRAKAYEAGQISAVPLEQVLAKFQK